MERPNPLEVNTVTSVWVFTVPSEASAAEIPAQTHEHRPLMQVKVCHSKNNTQEKDKEMHPPSLGPELISGSVLIG